MYGQVIEEPGYRVLLEQEDSPVNPREEWNNLAHVVTVPSARYIDVDEDGGPLADAWATLNYRHFCSEAEVIFTRYARIFHGATVLVDAPIDGARSVWYLMPEDIERQGITNPVACLKGERDTYRQWAEGDVYGWVVEESVIWVRVVDAGDAKPDKLVTRKTWEVVDASWGIYGYEYAEEAAREALARYVMMRSRCDGWTSAEH
ncbi:hypothetical protein BDK92_2609 [Micromonospora pisi]|uniref:Uncharacterized protein n=1 Tax=Micromonospora pisi TaxID=589240 RepID=A0A495JIB1_9ACTN|nr:hypothetical protein [Micromonospora pisi]RKR88298.1 hypothetical protein BDK92_2609 [Micromonospora pisi]